MAHAHGEFFHLDVRQPQGFDLCGKFSQLSEIRADRFRVLFPGRQGHQSLDTKVLEPGDLTHQLEQLVCRGPGFGLLLAEIDLDENVYGSIELSPLAVYFLGQ